MNTIIDHSANPYVGPRTFSQEQRHLFFGRDREGRDLLARVLSERLVLFYAQSGAGKSSLINARLIPGLREVGYAALPVGRVSGELPSGVTAVDNIYLFNLMLSIAQTETHPSRFTALTLSRFLAGLSSEDGRHYAYDEATLPLPTASTAAQPYVLIIDQFEELITSHPGRWQEREKFFRQLNQAMLDDPDLWVVLVLREDYIASIEPYAPLLVDRMRARFHMTRLSVDAALEAIRRPAEVGGRRFAAGVAEKLVDDLRQVRAPGQETTIPGQYVEPVQLQVACYQLWENLVGAHPRGRPDGQMHDLHLRDEITFTDLAKAGDVDQALTQFYEDTLAAVLAEAGTQVTERGLRTWFDKELITAAGTRNLVRQGKSTAGSLPNAVVGQLQRRFLVRGEARSGDTWIELVHDRFVEPICESNRAWFACNLNPLTQAAQAWREADRNSSRLYVGAQLAGAAAQLRGSPNEFGELEREFIEEGQKAESRRAARRQRTIASSVALLMVVLAALAGWALWSEQQAHRAEQQAMAEANRALNAEATAQAERGVAQVSADLAATSEAEARAAEAASRKAEATAVAAQSEAIAAREQTVRLTRGIRADQLTANALKVIDESPPLAMLLGVEGLQVQHSLSESVAPSALSNMIELLSKAVGRPLAGHTSLVNAVAFSPDGRWLATASYDNTTRLWDMADPAADPIVLTGHTSAVSSVAFSPDGRWLATGAYDATARLWSLPALTLNPAAAGIVLTGHGDLVTAVAFSPDSRWLATGSSDSTARLWDLKTPDPATNPIVLAGHTGPISAVTFGPDGRWLATGAGSSYGGQTDFTVRLWDVIHPTAAPIVMSGHEGAVTGVAFSTDGRWLATGSSDNTARLWNLVNSTAPIILSGHVGTVNAVAFSPDSRWLATGSSDSAARLWSMLALAQNPASTPIILTGHAGSVAVVAFSSDSHWLATGSYDNNARLWNVPALAQNPATAPIVLTGQTGYIRAMTFSPDGRWLATGSSDSTARLWDVSNPASPIVLTGHTGPILATAFSPDGRWLATGAGSPYGGQTDNSARLWNVANPAAVPIALPGHANSVNAVAFSPDGRWLATGSRDTTARLYDLNAPDPTAAPIVLTGHTGPILAVAFSPDGRWLATGAGSMSSSQSDNTARLWDLKAPDLAAIVLTGHEGSVNAVAFSPDARWLATGSSDASARLWDLKAADLAITPIILTGHTSSVNAVAFSPDGRWLATGAGTSYGSQTDNTARLWDLNSPSPIATIVLAGHENSVSAVAFSPDSCWLATGSSDTTARLWNLADPATPTILTGQRSSVNDVAFSPDGHWLATGAYDSTARLWTWRVADLIEMACRFAGRNLTLEEQQRYFQDNEHRITCPQWSIHPSVTQPLRDAARSLAEQGDITGAVARYNEALAIDPNLAIKPETEAKRLYAAALVGQGRRLAGQGDTTGATAKFNEALTFDPELGLEPEVDARRIYAAELIVQGRQLTEQSDINGATTKFQEALALNTTRIIAGQAVNGMIMAGAADFWVFEGKAGQVATIDMQKDDSNLDSYLTVISPDLHLLTQDDDSGNGADSRIANLTLPLDGVYLIVASGFGGGSTGAYRLELVMNQPAGQ